MVDLPEHSHTEVSWIAAELCCAEVICDMASVSEALLFHCCSMVLGGGAGVKEVSIVWKAPSMSSQSAMFV